MNKCRRFRSVLLAFALLLLGVSLACFVWVHKEQGQYSLNRRLIAALRQGNTKQTINLVEAGADPNTREEATPSRSLLELINLFWHPSLPPPNHNSTALMMACGAAWTMDIPDVIKATCNDPQLTQAMLLHGANVNAINRNGVSALDYAIFYQGNKIIIKQLLDYGADPTRLDPDGNTPIEMAQMCARPEIVTLLRKYSKHP